jgi:hypothetical protein
VTSDEERNKYTKQTKATIDQKRWTSSINLQTSTNTSTTMLTNTQHTRRDSPIHGRRTAGKPCGIRQQRKYERRPRQLFRAAAPAQRSPGGLQHHENMGKPWLEKSAFWVQVSVLGTSQRSGFGTCEQPLRPPGEPHCALPTNSQSF